MKATQPNNKGTLSNTIWVIIKIIGAIGLIASIMTIVVSYTDFTTKICRNIPLCSRTIQHIILDYEDYPTNHGWIFNKEGAPFGKESPDLGEPNFPFDSIPHEELGSVMCVSLPEDKVLDYLVNKDAQLNANAVEWVMDLRDNGVIYLVLELESDNRDKRVGFLKVLLGEKDALPYPGKENEKNNEWTITIEDNFIFGDFSNFYVDLQEEFSNTFGKDGLKLNGFKGLRVRGDLCLDEIKILEN